MRCVTDERGSALQNPLADCIIRFNALTHLPVSEGGARAAVGIDGLCGEHDHDKHDCRLENGIYHPACQRLRPEVRVLWACLVKACNAAYKSSLKCSF